MGSCKIIEYGIEIINVLNLIKSLVTSHTSIYEDEKYVKGVENFEDLGPTQIFKNYSEKTKALQKIYGLCYYVGTKGLVRGQQQLFLK